MPAPVQWPPLCRDLGIAVALLWALGGCGEFGTDIRSIPSPAGPGSAEPHLASGPGGTVVLSWLEPESDGFELRYASLAQGVWQQVHTVARGSDWFVNWADFPSVTPINEDLWAAHWLVTHPGGSYAYDVAIALSEDGGDSWNDPVTPHTDNTAAEHGFVSLFPSGAGVGAIWLDGRNMTADEGGGHDSGHDNGKGDGMTLRSVVVTPGGALEEPALIDDLVCDCCQTDVALTPAGPVAVYRDRTSTEVRDIYLAHVRDGQWQPGRAVADDGWKIAGCPVNGPAVDAVDNVVAVAWYTEAQERPRVRFARSPDGGGAFAAPVDVDAERPLGRVDVAVLDDGAAAVSWLRRAGDRRGQLVVRRVSAAGTLGRVHVVAETSTSRPAGFPQMVRSGGNLLFAWTHRDDQGSGVRTGTLGVNDL